MNEIAKKDLSIFIPNQVSILFRMINLLSAIVAGHRRQITNMRSPRKL